jgi:hypothetical protein
MDGLTGNTTEELLHMIKHHGLREILQRDFAESKRVVGHMVQQSGGLINTIRKKNDQIENQQDATGQRDATVPLDTAQSEAWFLPLASCNIRLFHRSIHCRLHWLRYNALFTFGNNLSGDCH